MTQGDLRRALGELEGLSAVLSKTVDSLHAGLQKLAAQDERIEQAERVVAEITKADGGIFVRMATTEQRVKMLERLVFGVCGAVGIALLTSPFYWRSLVRALLAGS